MLQVSVGTWQNISLEPQRHLISMNETFSDHCRHGKARPINPGFYPAMRQTCFAVTFRGLLDVYCKF